MEGPGLSTELKLPPIYVLVVPAKKFHIIGRKGDLLHPGVQQCRRRLGEANEEAVEDLKVGQQREDEEAQSRNQR